MPLLQVLSTSPRAGKSSVAAGIAFALARRGRTVHLYRAGGSENAAADAEAFSELPFVSALAEPVADARVAPPEGVLAIVELDAGQAPVDAPAVVVARGKPTEEFGALASALGQRLAGVVLTAVPARQTEDAARALTSAGVGVLAVLPEDRALAAPNVDDIRSALAADVMYEGENFRLPVQEVLVAPVYTDGFKLHLRRFEASKAVLAPSYKTDLLLAAIEAEAACVVMTGGHRPSHYVLDRVQGQPTTLLLAQQQTPAAVAAMSDVWGGSPFRGEEKAAAMAAVLEARVNLDELLARL
jgi:BioD-like phosphotransacetylase family protein